MTMTDFSEPQRMSPGAFLIIFAKNFKGIFSAVLVGGVVTFFSSDEATTDGILSRSIVAFSMCIGITLLVACASYFPKKFYVREGNLIFTHGFFIHRETVTIPLDKIHSLRTSRGILYQLFNLRGVSFDTLATMSEEIELILDEKDWESLKNHIEKEEKTHEAEEPQLEIAPASAMIRFDNRHLLLDALCQNHLKGAAVLGGFIAVIFDRISDFTDDAAEKITDYTFDYIENLSLSPLEIVGLLVAVYLVVLLLWLGKVVLRYFDMYLNIGKTLLTFNYGMLTRSSSRFAYDKVCTVWVKRNFFEKKLDLCTLWLKQALYASAQKEEDNLKLYGRDTSDIFLKWWLGDDYASSSVIISSKSGKGVLTHYFIKGLSISSSAALGLCYFQLYVWLVVPALYFLILIARGFGALCHSRITLKESHLIVENGHFADIRNYMKYGNVDIVRIVRSPFTRFFHRVTLVLSTSGSSFKIRSLKEEDARLIYELLLYKSERDAI